MFNDVAKANVIWMAVSVNCWDDVELSLYLNCRTVVMVNEIIADAHKNKKGCLLQHQSF